MLAAVVQLTSGIDLQQNLERAEHWIACAAQAGARLVALPENFAFLGETETAPEPPAQSLEGPLPTFLRVQAKRHGVWLAGGTFPEAIPAEPRHYNTATLIDPEGTLVAYYRKIHLFDVTLPGATHRESQGVAPGDEAVIAQTPFGGVGLSVCYDLRFPELYRALSRLEARILLIPAAFTVPTGRDHWEVLLRARAIENQCFVLAAAQYGVHNPSRRSYGRSMIVDPWGTVLAGVPDTEGFALAELDFEAQDRVRLTLPALRHRHLGL